MRAVCQRVREARAVVDGRIAGEIGPGLCVLVGIAREDGGEAAERLAARGRRLLVVAVVLTALGGAFAPAASAPLRYGSILERIAPGQMGWQVQNLGSVPIRLVAVRGGDFEVTGLVRAAATSGPQPACALSGQPATLRCAGFELPKQARLTVVWRTTGAGRTAEEAVTDGSEPSDAEFTPNLAFPAHPRGTYRVHRLGKHRIRLTLANTGLIKWTRATIYVRDGVRVRILSIR